MKEYFVYITTNENKTVLYTGMTSDLTSRLIEHKTGAKGENSYTSRYGATRLLYYEKHGNAIDAITREKEIKGWRREKKIRLIESQNSYWKFLDDTLFSQHI